MLHLAGLDIGGTQCAALLAAVDTDADGLPAKVDILDRAAMDTDTAHGAEHTLERLFALLRGLLDRHPDTARRLEAVGVSCGGPLDARLGVIQSPPNLPGWDNVPIVRRLTDAFGLPAFLQNDANACALVEWRLGAGRGVADLAFLTMGTGMGAGIIADGALLEGANGMAGEVGHLRLAEDGPAGYGKAGSFEGFCGGSGIARLARDLTHRWLDAGQPPAWVRDGHAPDALSVRLLAGYADAGDPQARELFRLVGERLGRGVAVLLDVVNPARVVIGSIFVRCERHLRPAMEAAVAREALEPCRRTCAIVPAQTGEAIGDLAAVLVAAHGLSRGKTPAAAAPSPTATNRRTAVESATPPPLFTVPAPASGTSPAAGHGRLPALTGALRSRLGAIEDELFVRYPALVPERPALRAAYELIEATVARGGKILVAGNGGSAADAEHIVGELMKGFMHPRPLPAEEAAALEAVFAGVVPGAAKKFQRPLAALSLTNHPGLSTAYANDVDPEFVFAQQVLGYGAAGDLFWGLSTSGNSRNVVYAALTAKARGLSTLAMTGPGGGHLGRICGVCLRAPGACTPEIQEFHLPIYHTLCRLIEARCFS